MERGRQIMSPNLCSNACLFYLAPSATVPAHAPAPSPSTPTISLPLPHLVHHHTMRASTSAFLLVGLAAQSATAASWSLTDTIGANDFMSKFDWYTRQDPTNGLVLYQSLANAQAANLSSVTNGQFIMSVDTVEVAAEGRRSIRISSSKSYSDGVYV